MASFCRHQNFYGRDYSGSVNLNGGGGCRRIAVPIHDLGARWRLAVSSTLLSLYLQERVPIFTVQEVGWVTGLVWTGTDYLFLTGVRTPDLLAGSESSYPQHYPVHIRLL
jgi:hypothetical protein